MSDFKLAERYFSSRLLLGTSQYPDQKTLLDAIEVSGAEIVTVSIRRMNVRQGGNLDFLQELRSRDLHILPNTAGCFTAKEAVLTAELAREALQTEWIKLEVIGDDKTLLPDVTELLRAADELVHKGFKVLPYCNDDLVTCRKLAKMGCAAVMPLGSPIGSGMGILNPYNFQILRENIEVPLILDAGVGTPSDVTKAMEMGFDAVLINTAIAQASQPVVMAEAMKLACLSGRLAYQAGRIARKLYASTSSPKEGMICR